MTRHRKWTWYEVHKKYGNGCDHAEARQHSRMSDQYTAQANRYLADAAQASNPSLRKANRKRAEHARYKAEYWDAASIYGK